ncbi:hypothetical protein Q7C36_010841 [Tachysurus vachellii]|uniref:Uncharacterized protein n=1 Tax=Tachysurus vachellii TaxID=175792 RepID=A0AA88SQE3_TACVA|nr:hypothetical protein Q7C36_010841 [Tachysurus vachellii]
MEAQDFYLPRQAKRVPAKMQKASRKRKVVVPSPGKPAKTVRLVKKKAESTEKTAQLTHRVEQLEARLEPGFSPRLRTTANG